VRYRQEIQVSFRYDVVFTRDLFAPGNETLAETVPPGQGSARAAVVIDRGVLERCPDLPARIARWTESHPDVLRLDEPPLDVPGGEDAKNDPGLIERLTRTFERLELCRHSYVMAVGGGAVLDAAGFAAALFHRGLRLLRVPTTVLSQSDSAVGVKNAVNFDGLKNLVGTFAPPFAVLNDALFLEKLDRRDWTSGLSESFKVAAIKDAAFIEEIEALADRLAARDLDAMERVVKRCALLHLDHIRSGGDPFELGTARPLDFGHWSAHKLESLSGHEVRHGEAVAIGIALDLHAASKLGRVTAAERDRVARAMERCGLALWHPLVAERDGRGELRILAGLEEFRQHLGGRLTLTIPDGLGRKTEIHDLPAALVEEAVEWLSRRAGAAGRSPLSSARPSLPQG
jgi:3-dehydroquinate synthase